MTLVSSTIASAIARPIIVDIRSATVARMGHAAISGRRRALLPPVGFGHPGCNKHDQNQKDGRDKSNGSEAGHWTSAARDLSINLGRLP